MSVVLIGYRGSGKTSVGRLLAVRLGVEFLDTDELIVDHAGRSIAEIFAEDGEPVFRDLEHAAIEETIERPGCVISVGGGAVEREDNRCLLRSYGRVVWLTAPAEVLWQRMCVDPQTGQNRPNLAGGGQAEVEQVLTRRGSLYRETAHLTVEVGSLSVCEVVDLIAKKMSDS